MRHKALVKDFVGYDTVVMNWLISLYGGRGFLYGVHSNELFNLNYATEFVDSTEVNMKGRSNFEVAFSCPARAERAFRRRKGASIAGSRQDTVFGVYRRDITQENSTSLSLRSCSDT